MPILFLSITHAGVTFTKKKNHTEKINKIKYRTIKNKKITIIKGNFKEE